MSRKTAADMVGLTIYAKRRLPILRWPESGSPVLGFINSGQRIGIIRSWINRKPGKDLWYWEFDDPQRGDLATFYVAHIPEAINMPKLKEDFEERDEALKRRRMAWYQRVVSDGSQAVIQYGTAVVEKAGNQIFTGVLILGGIYMASRFFKDK